MNLLSQKSKNSSGLAAGCFGCVLPLIEERNVHKRSVRQVLYFYAQPDLHNLAHQKKED